MPDNARDIKGTVAATAGVAIIDNIKSRANIIDYADLRRPL